MNTTRFAKLTGVSPNTVRRWTEVYRDFLSPTATPQKGSTRVFTNTDLRVLYYVATLRDSGVDEPSIIARLQGMQDENWQHLPLLPEEWTDSPETITVETAIEKASQTAQVAVLQTELRHTQAELEKAHQTVEELENRLGVLETRLEASEGKNRTVEAEKTQVQLDLANAKGEAATLQAQLDAYALSYGMGRGKPLPIAAIIAGALLAGALLVLITMVVVRLVL